MKNKYLKKALEETVKEIQGYSKEELEQKLSEAKESNLARTIDVLVAYSEYISELGGANENTK